MQWALPVAAYLGTAIAKDGEGAKQYTYSLGTTVVITSLMKDTALKMRPSSDSRLSFPSGHTSAAFSGAAFINTRYGKAYGIPAYALAAFTGYSRLVADAHHVDDVLAGMSVALFSNWFWVTPYKSNVSVTPVVMQDTVGVSINISEKGKNTMPEFMDDTYPKYRYEMILGPATLEKNLVAAPAATGTSFDLFDFDGINDPTNTANIIFRAQLNKYHAVGFSIAPFEARDTGQFATPVSFAGSNFPADTDLVSSYRRTDIRFEYFYNVIPKWRGNIRLGAALTGLRTSVELATADSTVTGKANEWIYLPFAHLDIDYPLSSRWTVAAEVNGAAWSDVDHYDTNLMFRYRFDRHWEGGIGTGVYDSKIDIPELKNEVTYNLFLLSVAYDF